MESCLLVMFNCSSEELINKTLIKIKKGRETLSGELGLNLGVLLGVGARSKVYGCDKDLEYERREGMV